MYIRLKKVKYKCDDGQLAIKLYFEKINIISKNYLLLNILLTRSMVIQKQKTQIFINDDTLLMRFNVTSNLFTHDWIFTKIENLSLDTYCYKMFNQENLSNLKQLSCM